MSARRWLTAEQALAIRNAWAAGAMVRELVDEYGVGISTIYDVVHGRGAYRDTSGPISGPRSKLTPTTVLEIRQAHYLGATRSSLAAQYGVHHATVCSVVAGDSWANVGGPLVPRRTVRTAPTEVDKAAVERALEDLRREIRPAQLTRAERAEVIRLSQERKLPMDRTRRALGVSGHTWKQAMTP